MTIVIIKHVNQTLPVQVDEPNIDYQLQLILMNFINSMYPYTVDKVGSLYQGNQLISQGYQDKLKPTQPFILNNKPILSPLQKFGINNSQTGIQKIGSGLYGIGQGSYDIGKGMYKISKSGYNFANGIDQTVGSKAALLLGIATAYGGKKLIGYIRKKMGLSAVTHDKEPRQIGRLKTYRGRPQINKKQIQKLTPTSHKRQPDDLRLMAYSKHGQHNNQPRKKIHALQNSQQPKMIMAIDQQIID